MATRIDTAMANLFLERNQIELHDPKTKSGDSFVVSSDEYEARFQRLLHHHIVERKVLRQEVYSTMASLRSEAGGRKVSQNDYTIAKRRCQDLPDLMTVNAEEYTVDSSDPDNLVLLHNNKKCIGIDKYQEFILTALQKEEYKMATSVDSLLKMLGEKYFFSKEVVEKVVFHSTRRHNKYFKMLGITKQSPLTMGPAVSGSSAPQGHAIAIQGNANYVTGGGLSQSGSATIVPHGPPVPPDGSQGFLYGAFGEENDGPNAQGLAAPTNKKTATSAPNLGLPTPTANRVPVECDEALTPETTTGLLKTPPNADPETQGSWRLLRREYIMSQKKEKKLEGENDRLNRSVDQLTDTQGRLARSVEQATNAANSSAQAAERMAVGTNKALEIARRAQDNAYEHIGQANERAREDQELAHRSVMKVFDLLAASGETSSGNESQVPNVPARVPPGGSQQALAATSEDVDTESHAPVDANPAPPAAATDHHGQVFPLQGQPQAVEGGGLDTSSRTMFDPPTLHTKGGFQAAKAVAKDVPTRPPPDGSQALATLNTPSEDMDTEESTASVASVNPARPPAATDHHGQVFPLPTDFDALPGRVWSADNVMEFSAVRANEFADTMPRRGVLVAGELGMLDVNPFGLPPVPDAPIPTAAVPNVSSPTPENDTSSPSENMVEPQPKKVKLDWGDTFTKYYQGKWRCDTCNSHNEDAMQRCASCDAPRGALPTNDNQTATASGSIGVGGFLFPTAPQGAFTFGQGQASIGVGGFTFSFAPPAQAVVAEAPQGAAHFGVARMPSPQGDESNLSSDEMLARQLQAQYDSFDGRSSGRDDDRNDGGGKMPATEDGGGKPAPVDARNEDDDGGGKMPATEDGGGKPAPADARAVASAEENYEPNLSAATIVDPPPAVATVASATVPAAAAALQQPPLFQLGSAVLSDGNEGSDRGVEAGESSELDEEVDEAAVQEQEADDAAEHSDVEEEDAEEAAVEEEDAEEAAIEEEDADEAAVEEGEEQGDDAAVPPIAHQQVDTGYRRCTAIAKTTNNRCTKRAQPGRNNCHLH